MSHEPALDAAAALIDLVVHGAAPGLRERLVLETALAAAGAEVGALWRRAPDGAWQPSVERGRRGGRFETEREVRRALSAPGAVAPAGHALVRCEVGGRGAALVVCGGLEPAVEDALEALLAALVLVEAAAPGTAGPPAPLPAPRADGAAGRREHDVRNALASLLATRQVLERFGADLGAAERAAFEQAIARECRRAGALVAEGFGPAARPAGAGPHDAGPQDAASAADTTADVAALERAAIESGGGRLDLDLAARCAGAAPACGAVAWSRIVRNLIRNAREAADASGRGAQIRVSLARAGERLVLTVEDRSGGLPEGPPARLFAEGATLGKPGGSGRGLAAVRELAVNGGGAVLAERQPGGARFVVWMPLRPGAGE